MAVARGVAGSYCTSVGVGGGGGPDEVATAATTGWNLHGTVTTPFINPSTTSRLASLPPGSSSIVPTLLINNGNVGTDEDRSDCDSSSLLQSAAGDASVNSSGCRRDGWSRVPLGVPSISRRSPPPPTAVEGGAAQRSDGRPAARVASDEVTTRPRPGPASLLTSTAYPQQGHATTGFGRAGYARRANGTGVSEMPNPDAGLVQGPARVSRSAMQVIGAFISPNLHSVGTRASIVDWANAAAGIRVAPQMGYPHSTVKDHEEKETGHGPEPPTAAPASVCDVAHGGSASSPVGAGPTVATTAPRRRGGPQPTLAAPWA